MERQIIIAIGRENGSGGHFIAQSMADQMQIDLYDKKNIIEGTISTSGYSRELINKMDEKPVNFFSSRRIEGYTNSLEANVAEKTFEFIKQRAESGESFVVVGRCADYVLRGNPNVLRIFICGDKQDKIQRMMKVNQLTESKAAAVIKDTDRKRKSYHNYYCDTKWGDSRYYDMTINSSRLGIEKTVDSLVFYARLFRQD